MRPSSRLTSLLSSRHSLPIPAARRAPGEGYPGMPAGAALTTGRALWGCASGVGDRRFTPSEIVNLQMDHADIPQVAYSCQLSCRGKFICLRTPPAGTRPCCDHLLLVNFEHKYPLQPRRRSGQPYARSTMDWYRLMPTQLSTARLNKILFLFLFHIVGFIVCHLAGVEPDTLSGICASAAALVRVRRCATMRNTC